MSKREPITGFVWAVSYYDLGGKVWPRLTLTRGAGEMIDVALTDPSAKPTLGTKITLQPADYRPWSAVSSPPLEFPIGREMIN